MSQPVTVIAVVEGGNLQNVYCPNPDVDLTYLVVDYDLRGDPATEDDLRENLRLAHREEQQYGFRPSIRNGLPAHLDPEHLICQRLERCRQALSAYTQDNTTTGLIDLLADAQHWCRLKDVSFEELLATARRHFDQEHATDQGGDHA